MTLQIETIDNSPSSLGLICEFVSRYPPFVTYEFGPIVRSILYQLEHQSHLVGFQDNRVAAYVGWLRTSCEVAENWVQNNGTLKPTAGPHDAVAVTILAVSDPQHSLAMIRKAKSAEPGYSVYWKRYFTTGREPSSRVVRKKT